MHIYHYSAVFFLRLNGCILLDIAVIRFTRAISAYVYVGWNEFAVARLAIDNILNYTINLSCSLSLSLSLFLSRFFLSYICKCSYRNVVNHKVPNCSSDNFRQKGMIQIEIPKNVRSRVSFFKFLSEYFIARIYTIVRMEIY